jgi:hypothetical protein
MVFGLQEAEMPGKGRDFKSRCEGDKGVLNKIASIGGVLA